MDSLTDQQLLREYAEHRTEAAFSELVRRHIDLVFSAAVRMVCDSHLAEDVTQHTFAALAQNALDLQNRPVLSGWLHRTARNLAVKTVRTDVRRRAREHEAAAMNDLLANGSQPSWEDLAPQLDSALGELSETDRDALLLRYFERKSAHEMAETLGLSDDAAQKRVSRALERLRQVFARRGVTVGACGLAGLMSAHAVQAAPAGLALTISTSAALAGAATTTTNLTGAIAMTALKKTLIGATLAVAVGTGIYEARQVSNLRDQVQFYREQQAPLAVELERLRQERDDATNRLALLASQPQPPEAASAELLRLRGLAGVARRATEEADRLRAQLSQQTNQTAVNPMLGAMSDAMKQGLEQEMEGRLSRMTAALHLTPEQAQEVRGILQRQARAMGVGMDQAISGKFDKSAITRAAREGGDVNAQVKALLTPEQQAAYPAYERDEAAHLASRTAQSEVVQLRTTLGLTPEQVDPAYAVLYQVSFDRLSGSAQPVPGDIAGTAEAMQWAEAQKAKALEPILTPAQLEKYRQQQATQAKLVKDIMSRMEASRASE